LGWIRAHHPRQLLSKGRLCIQGGGPSPFQGLGIEQTLRTIAAEEHQGRHAQGMEIHPGLGGNTPEKLGRGIARGRPHQPPFHTPKKAEIQEHRLAIPIPAQQIGRCQIPVEQVLAVERHQHGEQLAKEKQHFPRAKHQLALLTGGQQLLVGASRLPLAHEPEILALADRRTHPGHLGMQHPLEPGPELASLLLMAAGPQPPHGRRGIGSEGIAGLPEIPLGATACAERAFQAIATANQLACRGCGTHH
jgi:hypothetical protein